LFERLATPKRYHLRSALATPTGNLLLAYDKQ